MELNNSELQNELTSNYLTNIYKIKKENKSNLNNPALLEKRLKNVNFEKLSYTSGIDTNINNYTLDDIINLLDIDINKAENYNELKDSINDKIDNYVKLFNSVENNDLVKFFDDVRTSLLGNINNSDNNITEAEKLLLVFNDKIENIENDNTKPIFENENTANQVFRKTVSKLLTVDSRFRRNYDITGETDFIIDLPYTISNVIELKLSDLEFPATYYPFDDTFENNYFWVKYKYNLNNLEVQKHLYIYIPEGNYYHTNLLDLIQTAFIDNGIPLTVTFNLDYGNSGGVGVGNGKICFEFDQDSSFNLINLTEFELNFDGRKLPEEVPNYNVSHIVEERATWGEFYNKASTIDYKQRFGWMFGFRKKRYYGKLKYDSEGVLDILGPKYIYLVVDDYNTSSNVNFFSNNEDSLLDRNILARISLKGYPFSIQAQGDFRAYSEPRLYYGPVDIHKLRVKLIDEYGRTLSLNGMDFSFALSLITIYSQTN